MTSQKLTESSVPDGCLQGWCEVREAERESSASTRVTWPGQGLNWRNSCDNGQERGWDIESLRVCLRIPIHISLLHTQCRGLIPTPCCLLPVYWMHWSTVPCRRLADGPHYGWLKWWDTTSQGKQDILLVQGGGYEKVMLCWVRSSKSLGRWYNRQVVDRSDWLYLKALIKCIWETMGEF